MRIFIIALLLLPSTLAAETRCGWLHNPTPANYWLIDRDGEWTLSLQGAAYPNGFIDAPWGPTPPNSWVVTNGSSYGYGCACFEGTVDPATRWATSVTSVTPLPLARCEADPALPKR